VPPIDSASTLSKSPASKSTSPARPARKRARRLAQAQSKGWKALWAKTTGKPDRQAPDLSDSVLNSIVSGIIIEQEQIGPTTLHRPARRPVRSRPHRQLLGVGGPRRRRSAPMLVIPVMITGSSFQSFESRNEWQRAWARFRTGNSPVDYVRTTGSGIDPLLLNADADPAARAAAGGGCCSTNMARPT
jgi:hypothetical protein